jgi:hypothetical protein
LRATASGAINAYAECQVAVLDVYTAITAFPTAAGIAEAIWSQQLTEGYRVFGTASSYTASAMMWDLRQGAYNVSITGVTLTILKSDGVTTAHAITLNSLIASYELRNAGPPADTAGK